MFDELKKYKNGYFSFKRDDILGKVCNAPKSESGVYIILASNRNEENIIYIGSSGKMQKDGRLKHRKGGIYDRIVNGKQFNKPRRLSWPEKMKEQQIDKLNIEWYVTFISKLTDIPACVESMLFQKYYDKYGKLPDWNEEV